MNNFIYTFNSCFCFHISSTSFVNFLLSPLIMIIHIFLSFSFVGFQQQQQQNAFDFQIAFLFQCYLKTTTFSRSVVLIHRKYFHFFFFLTIIEVKFESIQISFQHNSHFFFDSYFGRLLRDEWDYLIHNFFGLHALNQLFSYKYYFFWIFHVLFSSTFFVLSWICRTEQCTAYNLNFEHFSITKIWFLIRKYVYKWHLTFI